MQEDIRDRIVFVTGGANGIGRSIVSTFCHHGADVVFCDTDEDAGNRLYNDLQDYRCTFYHVDVADKAALEGAVTDVLRKKGNIDIIINNVGIGLFGDIIDISVEDFEYVLDINLRSVFITARLLAKFRSENENLNKYGRIINMASTRYQMSEPDSEAYAASKGGIVSLTHALAISLSKYNITVNCISPGWIDTGHSEIRELDHQQHPSNRVGKPKDITQACIFLCDPENDFINGQNIVIDGGMTKKMIYEE